MEPELLEKKMEWLESERRETNALIKGLQERIETFEKWLSTESQRREALQDEIGTLQARTQKIGQIDEALTNHRKEVSRQLEIAEKRRSEKEEGLDAIRKADLAAITRNIDELRESLTEINELQKTIETIRADESRATSERDALRKLVDGAVRASEESSGQMSLQTDEVRRMGRTLAEADAEIANLKKLLTQSEGKVEAIEDRTRRAEMRLAELVASEDERQSAQEVWLEKQNLQMVEYQHSWAQWERRFGEIETVADALNERVAAFQATFSKLKQMQTDLEEVILRLERRINEITEMQRLAENRLEQAWTAFQSDTQKRWSTFKLTEDERWREHDKLHEKLDAQLGEVTKLAARLEEQVHSKIKLDETYMQDLQDSLQQWLDSLPEELDLDS